MTLALAGLFLLVGALAGAVHFTLLARDAEALPAGGGAPRVILLRLGRFALSIAVLVMAALAGSAALLAAAAGHLAARQWALRRFGPAP
jgi:hypothetical protein